MGLSEILSELSRESGKKTADLTVKAALLFLDMPYVPATLEINETEQLVVNLNGVDCMTFSETCLALARTAICTEPHEKTFRRELQHIRYRDGKIDGYASRLHYAIDWLYDNAHKGILADVSAQCGGISLPLKIDFMSSHPDAYKVLKNNPAEIGKIARIEQEINKRSYFYIPKKEIEERAAAIKNGDIVLFVTSILGLDTTHMGIAYWQGNVLTFIHASSTAGKVIVNPDPLFVYCAKIKNNIGIMLGRAL
ncbi:MAG: DUF1460 domain-containing protein [Lactobacillales bacterium]|jgi:hypothetical protein|nr:DUF1460 domain-containing protein [Lactobacillales bacterium]